jgi:GNAT superfamily N-acetyltransferase
VIIRAVRPEEHERLGALTVAAYHDLPGHVPEPDYDLELADIAAKVAAGCEVVVAVDDAGTLLGGVCFVPSADNPYHESDDPASVGFRHLAVATDAQGRGAGRALVTWCIDRGAELGAARMVIFSARWMTRAHGLYEQLGFRRAPDLDWVPVPDVPLLGFTRPLGPETAVTDDPG